jgi:hypothetical protein
MKTTFAPCHESMARNAVGQASRRSHISNYPLERESVFKGEETAATPVPRRSALSGFFILLFAFCLRASAQDYSIDWHKIAAGGGTSTGGVYQITGTIGQHEAGGPLTGGNYSLTGGFWSLISAVQTPGLPDLTITHSGNSVIVSWPATGSYTLQQNPNLSAPGSWTTSGYPITTTDGTNRITITPPTGNLFFRLKQ